MLAFAILTLLSSCHKEQSHPIPDDLLGVWRAPGTKYEGRFLDISRLMLSLGVGGQRMTVYFIRLVKAEVRGKRVLYTFFCEDLEELEDRISLYYDPSDGGVIQLKNVPDVYWRKD